MTIPTLGVTSTLVEVGLDAADHLQVPPTDHPEQAAWYSGSPRPGEPGPAILLGHVNGHVNGRTHDGVFHDIGQLKAGDRVEVRRADGVTVVFRVTAIRQFDKASVPWDEIAGNTTDPEIRLVTCGGEWVGGDLGYADNLIVYATETRS